MYGFGYGLTIGSRRGAGLDWRTWADGLAAPQLLDLDFSKTDRTFQNVVGSTLADDPGEFIALAMDSGAWGGSSLAGEMAAQPELKGTGTIGIVGSTTAATYDTTTGAGTVSRSDASNQSYVTFPTVAGSYYRLDWSSTVNLSTYVRQVGPTGTVVDASSSAGSVIYILATGSALVITPTANVLNVVFTVNSLKLVPGNHATQATGASQPARQAGGVARFDGSNDSLLTSFLAQSGAMTLLYRGAVPATLAAVQTLMGSSGSSANRCWIGVNPSGRLCAGVGSQTESTIVGTTDVRGKSIVAALTFDGSTVSLYLLADGGVSQEYSAAQVSTPTTAIPFRVGGLNNNGSPGAYAAIDANSFKAAHRAMTFSQFMSIAARLAA